MPRRTNGRSPCGSMTTYWLSQDHRQTVPDSHQSGAALFVHAKQQAEARLLSGRAAADDPGPWPFTQARMTVVQRTQMSRLMSFMLLAAISPAIHGATGV